jgi:hypothetical protein
MQNRTSIEELRALVKRLATQYQDLWPVSSGRQCWYRIDRKGFDYVVLERRRGGELGAMLHRSLIDRGVSDAPLLQDCIYALRLDRRRACQKIGAARVRG